MTWNNPTDGSKLGQTKRHIIRDKQGMPISAIITSAVSKLMT